MPLSADNTHCACVRIYHNYLVKNHCKTKFFDFKIIFPPQKAVYVWTFILSILSNYSSKNLQCDLLVHRFPYVTWWPCNSSCGRRCDKLKMVNYVKHCYFPLLLLFFFSVFFLRCGILVGHDEILKIFWLSSNNFISNKFSLQLSKIFFAKQSCFYCSCLLVITFDLAKSWSSIN